MAQFSKTLSFPTKSSTETCFDRSAAVKLRGETQEREGDHYLELLHAREVTHPGDFLVLKCLIDTSNS